ncbi:MAG: hypothetical protein R3D83_05830 [Caenibius sp.]
MFFNDIGHLSSSEIAVNRCSSLPNVPDLCRRLDMRIGSESHPHARHLVLENTLIQIILLPLIPLVLALLAIIVFTAVRRLGPHFLRLS